MRYLIGIADPSGGSWKGTTAWVTEHFAQEFYEAAPLESYISIKTQEEWIGIAQGMTFLIEIKSPAFNRRCLSGLCCWGEGQSEGFGA